MLKLKKKLLLKGERVRVLAATELLQLKGGVDAGVAFPCTPNTGINTCNDPDR